MNPKRYLIPFLCLLGLHALHAQPAKSRPNTDVPHKRGPLLLAEDAFAGMAPEMRTRVLATAKGRPGIPKGKRRYLVHLREESDPSDFTKSRGIASERILVHAIKMFVACLADAEVEKLRDAGEVLGIEEEMIVAENLSQTVPTGLKRMGVEQFPTSKINGIDERVDVDVAVLEAGVQTDHPDLNVYRSVAVWGRTSPAHEYSPDNHGTAVAGVIGALDNDYGTVGIAPGVRIWGIDAGNDPAGFYNSDLYAGFDYVAANANEIEVLNCSFGSFYGLLKTMSSYVDAVTKCVSKGVVVVCGAGNDSRDMAGPNGVFEDWKYGTNDDTLPAALPESMAVSAVSPVFDRFASYSNFSASNHNQRKVFSPGAAIDVAAPTDAFAPLLNSSYGFLNGTSCATPHVSGLVALYIARHGRATDAAGVYRIRQAIVDAAQPQSSWQTADTLDQDSNPEGLAVASPSWLDPAPRITQIQKLGNRVEVETTTVPGYLHALAESDDLGSVDAWSSGEAALGSGSALTFLHYPTGRQHFYRLETRTLPWQAVDPVAVVNFGTTGTAGNGQCHLATRSAGDALIAEPSGKSLLQTLADLGGTGGMKVPWLADFAPAGSFSIETWLKPARNTAAYLYSPRIAGARETGGRGWSLNQYATGQTTNPNGFSFLVATGGTNYVIPSVQVAVDLNKWYHLVGVFDGTNALLYVDGSLIQSVPIPSGQNYLPPLRTGICLGSDYGNRWFEGRLDEAAFYPHALSEAQVLAHYQAGINPAPPIPYQQVILGDNPAGYWRFNEPE
jgi:subtilisin